jgi:restriction system protein
MLPRYTVEVSHIGLGKYRVVSGTDYYIVQAKAKALQLSWDEEYRRKQTKEREKNAKEQERKSRIRSKEERQQEIEEKIDEANDRTEEAKAALEQIQNTLHYALELKHAIKWEELKRTEPYPTPEPVAPSYLEYPNEPKREDTKYQFPPNLIPEPNAERYKPNQGCPVE